jgi:HEAT repeat protein
MANKAFEKKLEALGALDAGGLAKALGDANNFYVSRAAERVAKLELTELIPHLEAAFERFLEGGREKDPQCWAKVALVKALDALGVKNAELYAAGFRCVQKEPVWGGDSDTAAPLRAMCAQALGACGLDAREALRILLPGLADASPQVRAETVTTIADVGTWEGELLIRLTAMKGDESAEVTGRCFQAILALDQPGAVAFVAAVLRGDDEMPALEAAAALAESRHDEALVIIKGYWRGILDRDMRRTIAIALGASPLRASAAFLLEILEAADGDLFGDALVGLEASRYYRELLPEIERIRGKRRR